MTPLIHLLIPKEFRVYCRPEKVPGRYMLTTTRVSRCTCACCLTAYRGKEFRVAWTGRDKDL